MLIILVIMLLQTSYYAHNMLLYRSQTLTTFKTIRISLPMTKLNPGMTAKACIYEITYYAQNYASTIYQPLVNRYI